VPTIDGRPFPLFGPHDIIGQMKIAWIVLPAFTVLSFAQAPAKKDTPGSAKPDAWQRSKECSTQAEKAVAAWSQRTGSGPTDWNNHYSSKYDKCFVSISSIAVWPAEKNSPRVYSTALLDAFERSPALASYCIIVGHDDCQQYIENLDRDASLNEISKKLNGKPFADADSAEQEAARDIQNKTETKLRSRGALFCSIDSKPIDCAKAEAFIDERMKK
jgi:hypothetical protein